MSLAKHLAIAYIGCTALAPGRYVVGIHFLWLPDSMAVSLMTFCAIWTVADTLCFCLFGLFLIYFAHGGLIEQTDIQ